MQERTLRAREQLIHSGIELYSRFGLDGVSLRSVNQHAGSANKSAAHYHFKTKENFIRCIITHMFDIDQGELSKMTELISANRDRITQEIISMMAPLLFIYENRTWGKNGLKFLATVLISADANKLGLWSDDNIQGASNFIDVMMELLGIDDREELQLRATFLYVNFIFGLATYESTENTVFGDLSGIPESKQFESLLMYCRAGFVNGTKAQ